LRPSESDAYFATRPRGSQIGAWASQQSRPLVSRAALEAAVKTYERRFGGGAVQRPDYWRGYRLEPVEIEFWRDRPSRLHERLQFKRLNPGSSWEKQLLYP
jgi:pyridoxamine 5'-phosphate oxidase